MPTNGDVIDDHAYQMSGGTRLPDATRIAVLGEYGGLGRRSRAASGSRAPVSLTGTCIPTRTR